VFSLKGKDAVKPAGNWFRLLMAVFMKECLPTSFFVMQIVFSGL
jgi:hypothetical protein